MILEQQLTSLELSQKLKELGVKQESLFYYQGGQIYIRSQHIDSRMLIADNGERTLYIPEFDVSAFTCSELGEMLPGSITTDSDYYQLTCYKGKDTEKYFVYYENLAREDLCKHFAVADTEADARAKMLIYLLEQNLLTPEDINK